MDTVDGDSQQTKAGSIATRDCSKSADDGDVMTATLLQDEVVGSLRPMFPHCSEAAIREIVARCQHEYLGNPPDQTRLTNHCIDELLLMPTEGGSPKEKTGSVDCTIDLTKGSAIQNETIETDAAGPNSVICLIDSPEGGTPDAVVMADVSCTDNSETDSHSCQFLPSCSFMYSSHLSQENAETSGSLPTSMDVLMPPINLGSSSGPDDGARVEDELPLPSSWLPSRLQHLPESVPCAVPVITPTSAGAKTLQTSPEHGRGMHEVVDIVRMIGEVCDRYSDGLVMPGRHPRAGSSKAPSTMSRCPCSDCRLDPSGHHSLHHSEDRHTTGRPLRHLSPTQGGGDTDATPSPLPDEMGVELDPPSSDSPDWTFLQPEQRNSPGACNSGIKTADGGTPTSQDSISGGGDGIDAVMRAKLESVDAALLRLSNMCKTQRKSVVPHSTESPGLQAYGPANLLDTPSSSASKSSSSTVNSRTTETSVASVSSDNVCATSASSRACTRWPNPTPSSLSHQPVSSQVATVHSVPSLASSVLPTSGTPRLGATQQSHSMQFFTDLFQDAPRIAPASKGTTEPRPPAQPSAGQAAKSAFKPASHSLGQASTVSVTSSLQTQPPLLQLQWAFDQESTPDGASFLNPLPHTAITVPNSQASCVYTDPTPNLPLDITALAVNRDPTFPFFLNPPPLPVPNMPAQIPFQRATVPLPNLGPDPFQNLEGFGKPPLMPKLGLPPPIPTLANRMPLHQQPLVHYPDIVPPAVQGHDPFGSLGAASFQNAPGLVARPTLPSLGLPPLIATLANQALLLGQPPVQYPHQGGIVPQAAQQHHSLPTTLTPHPLPQPVIQPVKDQPIGAPHAPECLPDQENVQAPGNEKSNEEMKTEVLNLFPDVDPTYVLTKLEAWRDHPSPVNVLCNHLLETPSYPRAASKQPDAPPPKPAQQDDTQDQKIDFVRDYYKLAGRKLIRQIEYAMLQLQNDFRWIAVDSIKTVLALHYYYYAPTRICLEEILCTNETVRDMLQKGKKYTYEDRKLRVSVTTKDKQGKDVITKVLLKLLKSRRNAYRVLSLDGKEHLEEELKCYKDYLKNNAVEKDFLFALSMNEAEYEAEGQLIECGCCSNEVTFETMIQCLDGHLFCETCLQSYTKEAAYGQGRAQLSCMTAGCNSSYPRDQMEKCLTPKDMAKYDERVQEEAIRLASMEGLVRCPHCDFAALLDPGDKVFSCQNTDCMKETCRHCREDWKDHFGKRCEEVEKKSETNMRTSFEERMSQAQIRTCHRCKTGIMKDQGCNKMTCRCGAKMCYICREPDINYNHFCSHPRNPGQGCQTCTRCSLWTDPTEDDARAVMELEKELKVEQVKVAQAKEPHDSLGLPELTSQAKKQKIAV